MRTITAPTSLAAEAASPPTPRKVAEGASETFSRSVQLALLSLLKGDAAESCIAGLRLLGAMGPSEADYLALERDGLAIKGASTGHRILTPRGRVIAGNVAVDVAHRVGAHRSKYSVEYGANSVSYACSCGAHMQELNTPDNRERVRRAWNFHRHAIGQLVKTAPMAQGSPEDAQALLSASIQAFIRGTQGGRDG